ncbi:LysR family transcriptional regulator [Jeotgalibacillus soli]|uniref:HTH lysR-type domain-containing protein n=1 Tax=Jeotgalibacillus soli TaxID=889306 RepID=A0A0C2VYA8_9BACL|nr:LysR family transcriptional regulator [Jeotgalibacillus soli]KIL49401.1 hypothetical protein KP78_08690 [Jeotgalibacillus soli]
MNIENMRSFCLVVENGSVSQAARLSFISQPAVTRQVKQMEDEYGALLFERKDGKLELTAAGKTVYDFARNIVDEYDLSQEAVQELIGKESSALVIGASLTIGEYLMPTILGSYKKKEPDITIHVSILNTPAILEQLNQREIDLALVEGQVPDGDYRIYEFAKDELTLVTHPRHPFVKRESVTLDDVAKEVLICREANSGTRFQVERELERVGGLKEQSILEMGTTQAIKNAVEEGLGVSILPALAVAKECHLGSLKRVKLEGFHVERFFKMVQKPRRFDKKSVRAFVDWMEEKKEWHYEPSFLRKGY